MNNCKLAYIQQEQTNSSTIIINANEEPFPLRLVVPDADRIHVRSDSDSDSDSDLYDLYTINPRSLGECPRKYLPLENVEVRSRPYRKSITLTAFEAIAAYTEAAINAASAASAANTTCESNEDDMLYRSSYLCCGMCTRVCSVRCPWDVHFRIYMMYHRELAMHNISTNPSASSASSASSAEMSTMLKILSAPLSYKHALQLVLEEINRKYTGRSVKHELLGRKYLDTLRGDSDHKFDYGERWVIDEKTGRPKTNPESGDVMFIDWPKSGLCQHCLTKIGKLGGRY